jgi:hypothetical protein
MLLFLLIHSIFLKVCTRKHFTLQTNRAK